MTSKRETNPSLTNLARRARDGGLLSTLLVASACGGAAQDPVELETIGSAFTAGPGNNAFEFISQMPQVVASNGQTGAFDPALCASSGHAGLLFVRDKEDHVQSYNYSGANPNNWSRYGNATGQASPKTFAGRLSCAGTGVSGGKDKFVVVGRSKADNLLYWSAGSADARTNPYSDSTLSFSVIDASNTYSGSPAIGSHNGQVLLTIIGSDGKLYAYYKNPGGNWSGRIQGPSLSGWTLQGTPAVTYLEGVMAQYHIYVRATQVRQGITFNRFQRTYFTIDRFSGPASIFGPLMEAAALDSGRPKIDSDPAIEWTGAAYEPGGLENVLTLYYRSGDKFYQTSGDYYPEEHPLERVTASSNPAFTGTPSVHGGMPYEIGQHWFAGQDTSNAIWFGSSLDDSSLSE